MSPFEVPVWHSQGGFSTLRQETGKCTGIGFVNFMEKDSAERAIRVLNSFPFMDLWLAYRGCNARAWSDHKTRDRPLQTPHHPTHRQGGTCKDGSWLTVKKKGPPKSKGEKGEGKDEKGSGKPGKGEKGKGKS